MYWLDLVSIVLKLSSSITTVEANSTIFNYLTFGSGHFSSFLWYISVSGLKQSWVLIYVLYIKRVNYSLTVVVSKISFNKWQSIKLTKETEVINKENCFSGNPNIWTAKLWTEISNPKFCDKTSVFLHTTQGTCGELDLSPERGRRPPAEGTRQPGVEATRWEDRKNVLAHSGWELGADPISHYRKISFPSKNPNTLQSMFPEFLQQGLLFRAHRRILPPGNHSLETDGMDSHRWFYIITNELIKILGVQKNL